MKIRIEKMAKRRNKRTGGGENQEKENKDGEKEE